MSNADARIIGRRIKQHRKRLGLTQKELARSTRVTRGYISQLESGDAFPSFPTLFRIARALGTTSDDLIKGTTKYDPDEVAHEFTMLAAKIDALEDLPEDVKREYQYMLETRRRQLQLDLERARATSERTKSTST